MKFSQKPRKTFEVSQYFPGPGYYISQDQEQVRQQQNNQNLTTFGKKQRFNSSLDPEQTKIGPGSYQVTKSDFEKYNLDKQVNKKTNQKGNEQPQIRINAVPSIPSKNVKEGYQEIGDGLLIVMKNQKENENVGPGQYNPNYNFVKPRAQKAFIPKQMNQSDSLEKLDQKQKSNLNASQQSQIESIVQQNLVGLVPKDQNTIQEYLVSQQERPASDQRVRQIKGQRYKAELTSLVSRDPKKKQIGEYNLELLMVRERQLAKDDLGPPPGKYYNQNLHTSFKVQYKPSEYQCFDSSSQRFEENGIFKNKLGPGQYNLVDISQAGGIQQANAIKFGREKRAISDYEAIKSNLPGPGEYNLKLMQDIGNVEKYDLYKLKQSNLKFNSVFGSGSRRFTDQRPGSDVNPGPGSYTMNDSSKTKKRKRVKTLYMQSNSEAVLLKNNQTNNTSFNDNSLQIIQNNRKNNIENTKQQPNNISFNDQNTTNYTRIVEIDDISQTEVKNINQSQNKQPQYSSYVFKSQTNRFRAKNQSFDYKYNLDGSDKLGPGCYEIVQDIQNQKQTYNKGKDLLNKSPRITDKFEGIQIPKLGPGYYDPNIQLVKPKAPCTTKI